MPTKPNILKEVQSAESTISLFLGIVVVVVVGILLFNYFRKLATGGKPANLLQKEAEVGEILKEGASQESSPETSLPRKYTVKEGDNLWKISENFYSSGYNWVDIAQENNLKNSDMILVGQELTIPNVPSKTPTVTKKPGTISNGQYTVVAGDSLWKISVRAYQDGYKWPEIAKANNLANPDLIYSGNILTIPRQ